VLWQNSSSSYTKYLVQQIKLSVEAGNPEINVQVDRDKMASPYLCRQWV
jgi:hypothetical protein